MITYIASLACLWSGMSPLVVPQSPSNSLKASATSYETYYELADLSFRRRTRNDKSKPRLTETQQARWQLISSEFSRINSEAKSLTDRRLFDQAVNVYRELLQYEPNYVYAFVHMGDVRAIQGDYVAALELYKQGEALIENVPEVIGLTVEPLMRTGDIYAKQGKYVDAADAYRKIVYRTKENDWKTADGKSVKARLFPQAERFAYVLPGNRKFRQGNMSENVDVFARCALYLLKARQREEAFYVYNLGLNQLRLLQENYSSESPDGLKILNDINISWADALTLPKYTNARTFESACYVAMSLTLGESSWVNASGKPLIGDKRASLLAAQKAVSLVPEFAQGQLVLGLAYEKCSATEPDAINKAKDAYGKATKSSGGVAGAANIALRRIRQSVP